MLLTMSVNVKWRKNTERYYKNKGYKFTFYGDEFTVPVTDLQDSSNTKIQVICDYGGSPINKQYRHFKRSRINAVLRKINIKILILLGLCYTNKQFSVFTICMKQF
ncbi:hypothetical protein [Peribacillus sp. SCS-37]|uniref:hypothetical protein n=1 Tax=Paraperibacillus esterisolvens TaxID=3115296 RepID=UPI0039057EF9